MKTFFATIGIESTSAVLTLAGYGDKINRIIALPFIINGSGSADKVECTITVNPVNSNDADITLSAIDSADPTASGNNCACNLVIFISETDIPFISIAESVPHVINFLQ
jgi:hypothetical protein